MQTTVAQRLGIEFPVFAFSHCRDVVAAVSRFGGFGVLGAAQFSGQQLRRELDWIDDHVGDRPYGVDVIVSQEGADRLPADPDGLIPQRHREFAEAFFRANRLPPPTEDAIGDPVTSTGFFAADESSQVEIALEHRNVRLIVGALGALPAHAVAAAQGRDVLVGALAGSRKHALAHVESGVDIIIAQGTEAAGHCGEISTMVLVPEVVDAVGPDVPVLAAGGIASGRQVAAAFALGAQGVWTGSIWLAVSEADVPPPVLTRLLNASSGDTARTRSITGKPCRVLRTPWVDAWDQPDAPEPLPMPLQRLLSHALEERVNRKEASNLAGTAVGQVVGRLDRVRQTRDVMYDLIDECISASEDLAALFAVPPTP